MILALGGEAVGQPSGEMALHRPAVGEALSLPESLAARTTVPAPQVALIAADMDKFRGKEIAHLVEDFLDERIDRLVAKAELARPWIRRQRAVELGMRAQDGPDMAGHVDLRHDGDVALRREAYKVARILLRVKPGADARPSCRRSSELRFADDFQRPATEVRQVPVKDVELVKRHPLDVTTDIRERLEIVPAIETQAAPAKAGRVLDDRTRNFPGSGRRIRGDDRGRAQLPQGLDAEEKPGAAGSDELDLPRSHGKPVTLRAETGERWIGAETDFAAGGGDRQRAARGETQRARELPGDGIIRGANRRGGGHAEDAVAEVTRKTPKRGGRFSRVAE
ncbi:MAG: hypothetical protein WDO13_11080 [Verrucomicrobiota bacterium]